MIIENRSSPTGKVPAVSVSQVSKSYGRVKALQDIALTVEPGEVVGLLGPNGAGKTTLMSIIAGLFRPDYGQVSICGIDLRDTPAIARSNVGFSPQDLGIYPTLSVEENIRYFCRIVGCRRKAVSAEIDRVSEIVGLLPHRSTIAGRLSGGQKRRLHTALALVGSPPVLLLDEPTVGSDIESRSFLLSAVKELAGNGHAILYSTHYLPEIERLNASVVILDRGRILTSAPLRELYSQYAVSVVEIRVVGDPIGPESHPLLSDAEIVGNYARIATSDPDDVIRGLVDGMVASGRSVSSVSVLPPSLDQVFLTLTGRRFEPDSVNTPHDSTE